MGKSRSSLEFCKLLKKGLQFCVWRHAKILLSIGLPALLLILYLGVWACKFNQWDSLTYVTLVPFWMWAVLGIVLSSIPAFFIRNRFSIIILAIWVLTALIASAEAHGLFRQMIARGHSEADPDGLIRLVSINCHGGNLNAAREAYDLDPDLIFLQEAPSERLLEEMAYRIFGFEGSYVAKDTIAILGLGEFLTLAGEEDSEAIHARFKHTNGTLIDLTNLKLDRSIPKVNIWDETIREQMMQTRIKNRKAIRGYVGDYRVDASQPIRIIGGDFSTPPGDDIFRPLKKAGLRDSFLLSGRGTGNTFPKNVAFLRLNQVWVSPEAQLLKTWTTKSQHSDHRILICEFLVELEE